MNEHIKTDIDLLVHKAIDQLTVIKAATSLLASGANGDSLIDLKSASKRLKEIRAQIERKVSEIETLIGDSAINPKKA